MCWLVHTQNERYSRQEGTSSWKHRRVMMPATLAKKVMSSNVGGISRASAHTSRKGRRKKIGGQEVRKAEAKDHCAHRLTHASHQSPL